ncbi:MAG TPA: MFS transporter [Bacillota bacterium]|nr:MFS transporter [Bacillota bacterium]
MSSFTKVFPALSSKNFRYFWYGQCISLMGTWMQRTAQQWLVYSLTKSPLLLGFLGVAQFGPMLLFSLAAGVIIDRYPKRRMLVFTQAFLMLQALVLAALVLSGQVRYWHVLVLATVLGLMNTLDMPARQAFVIELVDRNHLTNGIALNSAIVNFARIAGPALAGMLIVSYSAGICFLVNGLSFLPVILGLSLIRVQPTRGGGVQGRVMSGIAEGLRYLGSRPKLLSPILALLIVGTFAMNMDVLIPVFADRVLHQGAHGYGFLLSASGFGALISAIFVAMKVKNNPSLRMLFTSGLIVAIVMVMANFVSSYSLAILLVAVLGFFNMLFMTLVNSTIQLNVDNAHRGRVMSVYTLAFGGTTPIGNLLAGSIVQQYGPGIGFLACGVITGLLLLLLTLWVVRS